MSEPTSAHIAADLIRPQLGSFTPQTIIVTGSGLDGLAKEIDTVATLAYSDIPGFPTCSVKSHPGPIGFWSLYRASPLSVRKDVLTFMKATSNSHHANHAAHTQAYSGCELMIRHQCLWLFT